MRYILNGIIIFLHLVSLALFLYAVLSWFLPAWHRIMKLFASILEPLLQPFRTLTAKIMPQAFPVDISVFLAIIALELAVRILRIF